jgi:hypothetical protein
VARVPRAAEVLAWARPLWWIARGWVGAHAVVGAASLILGIGYYGRDYGIVPGTSFGFGLVAIAVAVAVSLAIGFGRVWPGKGRLLARLVLLGLNGLAIVGLPVALVSASGADDYWRGYNDAQSEGYAQPVPSGYGIDEQAGIYSSGRWVTNIYPFDAAGQPLTGVQLFDQNGDPIAVVRAPECPDAYAEPGAESWSVVSSGDGCWDDETGEMTAGRVAYPWTNGAAQLDNVFPQPLRAQTDLAPDVDAFAQPDPPSISFPMQAVPPVSLPGITPSVVAPASPSAEAAPEATTRSKEAAPDSAEATPRG